MAASAGEILRCPDGSRPCLLTNHLDLPPLTVARLYQLRWQVELFFRWIKQNLQIKHFYGTSPDAVKTQVWIAVAVYVMIAILHKQLGLPGTLHRTMQVLSVHPFEKVSIQQLLAKDDPMTDDSKDSNPLTIHGL